MMKTGRYKILELLEKTDCAELYKVTEGTNGNYVLKIAKEADTEINGFIAREFHVLSQFNHENIVKVFDYGTTKDNRSYFTSEFIPGVPINAFLKGWSRVFVDIILQVLDALIQFHNHGYFHSDLKPDHIIYNPKKKKAVLIDFGFASLVNEWQTPRGTYGYIAPEVLRGSAIDQRGDLYSLGVIMYEILSRNPDNQSERQARYIEPPVSKEGMSSDVPGEIKDVISKLMATEPALRPFAGAVYETLVKFTSKKKRLKKTNIKMSLPRLPFMDICKITNHLEQVEKLSGKTFIVSGDTGIGKTTILKELRTKFLLSGSDVLFFSNRNSKRFFDEIAEYSGFKISEDLDDKFSTFEQVIDALNASQRRRNRFMVIMIDDFEKLECFDQSFFRYLGFSIKDSKIVAIATAKPAAEIEKAGFENYHLRLFTNVEVNQFIGKAFNNSLDGEFADWLYKTGGGNPLFMEEILRLLSQNGILYFKENDWHIAADAFDGFYCTKKIEDILIPRMKNLDTISKKILQILAIYDNPMEPIVLTHVAGMQGLGQVEYLYQIGLVQKAQLKGRFAYLIQNNIIKEIIEKSIPEKSKHQLYRKFFTFIKRNFSDLAEYSHFMAEYAEACNDTENAYKYYLKAAETAKSEYNFDDSVIFLNRAIKNAKNIDPDNLTPLFLKIGIYENQRGNIDAAISAYSNALKYSKNGSLVAEINFGLGKSHQMKGQYDISLKYFNKALALATYRNFERANVLNKISYSQMHLGNFNKAKELLGESLKIAEEIDAGDLKVKTLYLIASLEWFCRNYEKGIKVAKEALEITQVKSKANLFCECYNLMALLYMQQGDFKNAEKSYNMVIQLLQSRKNISVLINAYINSALMHKSQGEFGRAMQLLQSALDHEKKIGNNTVKARILLNLANIHEIKGDIDTAIELNKEAMDTDPDALKPVYSISMLWLKKGKIETAQKLLEDVSKTPGNPLYYFGQALLDGLSGKVTEAESMIKKGFEKIAQNRVDIFAETECYMKAIECCYNLKKYKDCHSYASEALVFLPPNTREYIIVNAIFKLCCFLIDADKATDINSDLDSLKKINCLYDWAYLKRMELESVYCRDEKKAVSMIDEISRIEEIFKNFGATFELGKIQLLKDQIVKKAIQIGTRISISLDYLRIIHRVSEIIHNHLGDEDYIERILDILIMATHADRGIFFIFNKSTVRLITGRNVDQETIDDARKISQSVIKETGRRGEVICCSDALADPNFRKAKSVILNQIRSFLCAPLKVDKRTIGAVYLDSSHACNLFLDDDRDFLLTVTNLIASTIERSKVFEVIKENNIFLRMGISSKYANEYLIGASSAIKEIRLLIDKVAKTDSKVLITGETGCGKGMVAKLIHRGSLRKNNKIVSVNCGSVPETLFESELFGYKRGAFTGAFQDKKGLFEEANEGTLFLDEISNIPLTSQGKLLEAIEEKTIRRLGETIMRNVNVRVISATNQNLNEMIDKQLFKSDLFYRLSVFTIHVPPLRERTVDIPILADHFLEKFTTELNRKVLGFSKDALRMMLTYSWPGNIRELQNAIERAVILTEEEYISLNNLKLKSEILGPSKFKIGEKEKLITALQVAKGNISLAARMLGITRSTLYSHIKKQGINITKNAINT